MVGAWQDPGLAELLVTGGDPRLDIDPTTRFNRYMVSPAATTAAMLGSCTASGLSAEAGGVADQCRERLYDIADAEREDWYARELCLLRSRLAHLFGLTASTELGITASGTDALLLAILLVSAGRPRPTVALMIEPAETGSGVWNALSGRHFGTRTATGVRVSSGARLDDVNVCDAICVRVREPDGSVRDAGEVHAEIDAHVARLARSHHVVLCAAEVSKTGLRFPSAPYLFDLKKRLGEDGDVIVDACQFRMSGATLRTYLRHGCLVTVTGSKFFAAPPFCGALLVPRAAFTPPGLQSPTILGMYFRDAELPREWAAKLARGVNPGLWLRWQVALHEMASFALVPSRDVASFLSGFRAVAEKAILDHPSLEPVPVSALPPVHETTATTWDCIPTIFPFRVRAAGGSAERLDEAGCRRIYETLATRPVDPIQLGQPVAVGSSQSGRPAAALRIAASARLVREGTASPEGRARVLRAASRALADVAALAAASANARARSLQD
jgi:hypothetical protein